MAAQAVPKGAAEGKRPGAESADEALTLAELAEAARLLRELAEQSRHEPDLADGEPVTAGDADRLTDEEIAEAARLLNETDLRVQREKP